MKRVFCCVALAAIASIAALHGQTITKTKVGPVVAEVVRLHQSGLSEDLMLAHVRNAANRAPTADEIIYLHDNGVSESVMKEMILRAGSPPPEQPAATSGNSGRVLTRPQWEEPGYVSPVVSQPAATQEPAPAAAPAPAQATVQVQSQPVYVTSPTVVAAYSAPRYYAPYSSYYPYYDDWYRPSLSIGFGFGHYWGGHHHHGHHGGHHGHGLHYRGVGGHRGH